jgi:hypothetical protein
LIRALLKAAAKWPLAEATIFGLAKIAGKTDQKVAAPAVVREIDAVYLWVNDADPKWQAKRQQFRPTDESTVAAAASRFRQFNELLTSIKLLAANAPFVRKVFVVVDEQAPNLTRLGHDLPFEIILVNHSDFIPEKYLPTFNSRAITAHLHLIPDLSERFLYLNDDVFIASSSVVEDWFDDDRILVRFTETRFPPVEKLANNEVLYRARWKGVQLAKAKGWLVDERMPQHAPYPLTKTIMKKLWEVFPSALAETAGARFRTAEAILPEQLAFYFAAGNGLARPAENSTYKYVPMNEASGIFPAIDLALKPKRFLTICLNDVSEVPSNNRISERALLKRYSRVLRFLESTVGK